MSHLPFVEFRRVRAERWTAARSHGARVKIGICRVATKDKLLRQAELLLKLARSTPDPDLYTSLVQRAADLQEIADDLAAPDLSPHAPDVERPPQ